MGEQYLTVNGKLSLHCVRTHLLSRELTGIVVDIIEIVLDKARMGVRRGNLNSSQVVK
jgi:hypothetical protein